MNWFEQLQLKNLKVGSVIRLWCEFAVPEPKYKFLVIASIEPRFLLLVINSEINQFYFERGLSDYHVIIPVADHDFLRHDSYANCLDAINSVDLTHVKDQVLENDQETMQGELTPAVLKDVHAAVDEQIVMRRGDKKEILAALAVRIAELEEE